MGFTLSTARVCVAGQVSGQRQESAVVGFTVSTPGVCVAGQVGGHWQNQLCSALLLVLLVCEAG